MQTFPKSTQPDTPKNKKVSSKLFLRQYWIPFRHLEPGGVYPYWFLHPCDWTTLNNGLYQTLSPAFMSTPVQTIYVFNNWNMKAMLYVHTPELDRPGLYAVFESERYGRDEAFYCSAADTHYICHRPWPSETSIIMMRSNILSVAPKARLWVSWGTSWFYMCETWNYKPIQKDLQK